MLKYLGVTESHSFSGRVSVYSNFVAIYDSETKVSLLPLKGRAMFNGSVVVDRAQLSIVYDNLSVISRKGGGEMEVETTSRPCTFEIILESEDDILGLVKDMEEWSDSQSQSV